MYSHIGVLIYVILQFLALLCLVVATPFDMFREVKGGVFGGRACVTLWGLQKVCLGTEYIMKTEVLWKNCPSRRDRFLLAQVFDVISLAVYAVAFLFGFILLWCCSAFRWVCLALNIVGIGTVCVVWVLMVKVYHIDDGTVCMVLDKGFRFGIGFGLLLVAWVLDIIAIFFLLLPLEAKQDSESTKSDEYREQDQWSYGPARPPPSTKELWDSLEGLLICVRPTHPANAFEDRPAAVAQPGMHVKSAIASWSGNATWGPVMGTGEAELSAVRERMAARGPPGKLFHSAKLLGQVSWLRCCVRDPRGGEAAVLMLFSRCWRVDVSKVVFVSELERGGVGEKAPRERDRRKAIRMLHRGGRRRQRGRHLKTAIEATSKAAQSSKGEGVLAPLGGAFAVKRKDEGAVVRRALTQVVPLHSRRAALEKRARLAHVGVRGTQGRPRSVEALGVDSAAKGEAPLQALACTQHTTDAVSRNHLINITAASGNGLAELLAAVHPRRVPAARHASQLQATCADGPVLRAALQQLSASPYDAGQHAGGDTAAPRSAALGDVVLDGPVRDARLFRDRLFPAASRRFLL
ncbi:Amastin surface glycofamily protein [Leishmania donovani]|uniref:Amastin surface glycofamily protein n=1 Tax=Leishmania donovani TaxID=5661 RepID=A0A504XVZ0_LEIDO|nr:Amastin surface glycofamily protein [Leishmania donovani]